MKIARISLVEVLIGIWLIAIIVILSGVFVVSNPLAYVLGELVGSLTASAMIPEKQAVNHSRVMGMVRSAVEIVVLFAAFFLADWISPYTVLAGLLARKIAALMVPWMEKIRTRGNKTDSPPINR